MVVRDPDRPWFHGSPLELPYLRAGSTLTQGRSLAVAFSHRPTLVSVADDGTIRHNGSEAGLLYRVSEQVSVEDVAAHPHTTMAAGLEYITARPLSLALVCTLPVVPQEQRLTPDECAELLARLDRVQP